jgi:phosphoribosylformimino-5-aminoimidazole carboxamide ribotide isomerase
VTQAGPAHDVGAAFRRPKAGRLKPFPTIIGVVDLLHGRAVHAVAGDRANYQPIDNGDPVAVATAYFAHPQVSALYVADLDAIERRASNDAIVGALVALGRPVWLDAGITTVAQATGARALGAATIVVGLETLTSFDALRAICKAIGGEHVAFSLDLRNGEPVISSALIDRATPQQLAARAVGAGAGALVVLDLARVGTSAGLDMELLRQLSQAVPSAALVAGGGLRDVGELSALAATGCTAVLAATALRTGPRDRIGRG